MGIFTHKDAKNIHFGRHYNKQYKEVHSKNKKNRTRDFDCIIIYISIRNFQNIFNVSKNIVKTSLIRIRVIPFSIPLV